MSVVDPAYGMGGSRRGTAAPPPAGLVEAVVQTGTVETPYRRAGSGPTVLLLSGDAGDAGENPLFRSLAERYRVIEPAPCPSGRIGSAEWASWLRNLIDGLGLETPQVVADGSVRAAVEAFDRSHPGRLGAITGAGTYGMIDV